MEGRSSIGLEMACVWLAQPLGIFTTFGFIKRLRNPWIRASAGVFTACTQALWERDEQVLTRRALVKLAKSPKFCLECLVGLELGPPSSYSEEVTNVANIIVGREKTGKIEDELVHQIHTLYDSKAIFWKSMMAGVSLGTLPFVLHCAYFYGGSLLDRIGQLYKTTELGKNWHQHIRLTLAFSGHALNSTYALPIGLSPYLNPGGVLTYLVASAQIRACDRQYESLSESYRRRALWYEREGKLPIFQYNVEEE